MSRKNNGRKIPKYFDGKDFPAAPGAKQEEAIMKRMRITLGAVFLALTLLCG